MKVETTRIEPFRRECGVCRLAWTGYAAVAWEMISKSGNGYNAMASGMDECFPWQSHACGRTFSSRQGVAEFKRLEEAVESYNRAIALNPDFAEAFNNRGNTLQSLRRFAEAVASYDKAIALKPNRAHQFNNRGNALMRLRRFVDALASYDKAITLDPHNVEAILNRARALFECRRYDDALVDCEKAVVIDPAGDRPMRALITFFFNTCDWSGLQDRQNNIVAAMARGSCIFEPLLHSAISYSEEERLLNARNWAKKEYPPDAKPLWRGARYRHDRIRIAYLSGDFREHAVSSLIAGVFARHDKTLI